MKKLICGVLVLLVSICSITTVFADNATPYQFIQRGDLTFSGTTAICTAYVKSSTDRIQVTMKLWDGNSCVKSWSSAGNSRISLQQTTTVTKGKSYTLTIDFSINDRTQPRWSQTKRC